MRYRLRTLLIVLATLAIGFGGGIAVEKYATASQQAEQSEGGAANANDAKPGCGGIQHLYCTTR